MGVCLMPEGGINTPFRECTYNPPFPPLSPFHSLSLPPTHRHTGGAAVLEGDVAEVHIGVLTHEHTAARCVVGVAGTPIHERKSHDAHTGYAVGNVQVPVKGAQSQKE